MNRTKTAIFAALTSATLIAGAGNTKAHDAKQTGTFYIALDGQCDVVQLTIFPWHQAGEFDNSCGAPDGVVGSGMWGNVTGIHPKDLTISETNRDDPKGTYLWNIQYPLQTGNTWSIYLSYDGVNYYYYASGTYTMTNREAMHSRRPGTPVHHLVRSN